MLARVEAIKAALGLPPSVVGAIPIVGAASVALGIDYAETAKLPEMVTEIETTLGLSASAPATAADATPAAAAPAAAAPAAGACAWGYTPSIGSGGAALAASAAAASASSASTAASAPGAAGSSGFDFPSAVPELLHDALRSVGAAERDVALRFFRQEEGGTGAREVILATETKLDEASGQQVPAAHVVLKLDFNTWAWKRVRKKVKAGQ